jgi:ABC-2 type transport system permease protein
MFKEIFLFELKYRFTRPATYLYFLIFMILPLMAIMTDNIQIGAASEKVLKNSPVVIGTYMGILSIFGILVASAIMGVPIYRDLEHKTNTYFFALPISEKPYLLGRFFGSFLTLAFVMLGIGTGVIVGAFLAKLFGTVPVERFADFNFMHYLLPYLTLVLPNIFLSGTIFFVVVALTRNVFSAYVGNVIFLLGYILTGTLLTNLDNKDMTAMLDVFGIRAYSFVTRYWTVPEQNSQTVALTGLFLYNRLLWVGVSLVFLIGLLFRFNFQNFLATATVSKKKKGEIEEKSGFKSLAELPKVQQFFSQSLDFRKMFSFAMLEFQQAIRNPYFLSMASAAVIFLLVDSWIGDEKYGTSSMPVTYIMLDAKNNTFSLLFFIIIIFYTGEMVFNDRILRFSNISDAFPVPNWLLYGSKFIGMVYICTFLTLLPMVSGMLVQTLKGYFTYEIDVYLIDLLIYTLPGYIVLAALSFFIQILVNNKFAGYFAVAAFWITMLGLNIAEYNFLLYRFGEVPNYLYSDMNKFGHFFTPVTSFNAYWLAVSGVLLVIGNLLWVRGIDAAFKERIQTAVSRMNNTAKIGLAATLFFAISLGVWNYYNVAILNKYTTAEEGRQAQVLYEKRYKKLKFVPQPKVSDVKLYADLIPEERQAKLKGVFKIWNDTEKPIDTLYLNMSANTTLKVLKINNIDLTLLKDDTETRFKIYKLSKTLNPKDSAVLEMSLDFGYNGFTNGGYNSDIVENGIFFNTGIFPDFGYNERGELASDKERKKNGLPEKKDAQPAIDDPYYKNVNFITAASDYVTFEAIISTAPDQIAIAPGYLQREWTENGRKYYHYNMGEAKDFLFFNVVSAKYEVLRDKWTGKDGKIVNIEIFHHPTHNKNLSHMVEGIKAALTYYSDNFSPYQHKQMRILEFPRYQTFAQSFANTVPYAESFGFVADFSDPNDTDYAYFVTAHEVAHQWWGHQVMPRATKGNGFVSETMSEYSALMVQKQRYGAEQMQKFLKYELDRYLRERGAEEKKEPPLLYEDGQSYLYYRKGSMIMYALADYIGEENLNKQLKKYVDTVAFTSKPYTSSLELYSYIKAAIPDSLSYLATDMFEKITLYDNRTEDASYKKISETEYLVTLTINTKKSYADEKGNESEASSQRDLIEIGIFAPETKDKNGLKYNKPLYLQKQWLTKGQHKLTFTVKEKPYKAGIDPYNKLIDRVGTDNVKVAGEE